MKDKTFDERYYILTLIGVAKELEDRLNRGIYRPVPNRPVGVELLVGLPPADFSGLYEKFENYFKREEEPVSFRYGGREWKFHGTGTVPGGYCSCENGNLATVR